jgi:hypothetical protein
MLPLIVGVLAASIFGIVAVTVFSPEFLLTNAWVDIVFWTLIAAGIALSAINLNWECFSCKLARWLKRADLAERLCREPPCAR